MWMLRKMLLIRRRYVYSQQEYKRQMELKDMFTRITVALDRLCNTNFTPSAAVATISVVSSAPALAMEEALPISVSNETQKAPEEVYNQDKS